jgi:galactokinase
VTESHIGSSAQKASFTLDTASEAKWAEYVRGVIAQFRETNGSAPSIQAAIVTDVPIGGGLSSSAALEVSVATLLQSITTGKCDNTKEKALLCQRAEHKYAHVPCGIMDQYISTFALANHALLLDCRFLSWC